MIARTLTPAQHPAVDYAQDLRQIADWHVRTSGATGIEWDDAKGWATLEVFNCCPAEAVLIYDEMRHAWGETACDITRRGEITTFEVTPRYIRPAKK